MLPPASRMPAGRRADMRCGRAVRTATRPRPSVWRSTPTVCPRITKLHMRPNCEALRPGWVAVTLSVTVCPEPRPAAAGELLPIRNYDLCDFLTAK